MGKLDPERARSMGHRSGEVRRQKAHQRPGPLTLERVSEALPRLDTPEHIRLAYELVQRWAAAGLLAGSVAGACVRAADGALKLWEAETDRERIRALEQRIRELEAELSKSPALRKVVSQ